MNAAISSLEFSSLSDSKVAQNQGSGLHARFQYLGEINPVREMCEIVHGAGAVALVDGISYAGHGFPVLHN